MIGEIYRVEYICGQLLNAILVVDKPNMFYLPYFCNFESIGKFDKYDMAHPPAIQNLLVTDIFFSYYAQPAVLFDLNSASNSYHL